MSTEQTIGLIAIAVLVAIVFVLVAINSLQVTRRERRKTAAATGGAEGVHVAGSDGATPCNSGDGGGSCSDGGAGGGD